jgi:hypothetical protein
MRKAIKTFGIRCSLVVLIVALGACPVGATVAGDLAAKLPLTQVITNGLAAGLTIEAVLDQALDAGATPEDLFKAALAQGADLTRLFKFFMDKSATDTKYKDTCTCCNLMKWAKEAGKDLVEIANAMMAAGGDLTKVRDCLASLGYPGADTYAYSPPGPPAIPVGVGPTFPGGGGGGGVASPAR